MKDSLILLSHFIKNPKRIGAVAASSKSLTREMVRNIDFKNSKVIVELGPGMGTFTKAILEKADSNTKVICFEVDEKFCRHISSKIKDKRLVVIKQGAENIIEELKNMKISKVDCIVSGLPFRNFPERKKERIFNQVKNSLRANGMFVLFQYTNRIADLLKSNFSKVSRKFVLLNVPPAFVYSCVK